jgi:hypothetical protein
MIRGRHASSRLLRLLTTLALSLGLAASLAAADSTRLVKLDEVPAELLKSIQKQAGKAAIVEVSKVIENGQTYYDAKFGAPGRFKILRVTGNDGRLVYKQHYLTETPGPVHKTISQQLYGGRVKRILKVYDEDGATFEVTIGKNGKDREVVVAMDGRLVSRQMRLPETPPVVQQTIRKELGKGELIQILKTVEDGEIYYQIDLVKEREEQQRTMNVAADGTLTSLQVFAPELPPKVLATIRSELRGGKVDEIYKTFAEDGVTFELDIIRRDKRYSVSVDDNGALLEAEMEMSDVPAEAQKAIRGQLGEVEIERVTKTIEEGHTYFAAEFTKNDQLQVVTVTAAGKVLDFSVEISLPDAPAAVQKTIKELQGKGEISSLTRTLAEGKTQFGAVISDDVHEFSAAIADDGKLLGTEEEITLTQAPAAVQQTITTKLAGAKLESLIKATVGSEVFYDVSAGKDGKALTFTVDAAGKYISKRDGGN